MMLKRRKAFTLLELIVVIAIIALIVGLLVPVAVRVLRTARGTARELSAARQLMVGYTAYALEHRGVVMPGVKTGLEARDAQGREVPQTGNPPPAATYVWRLAPYLDYNLASFYTDRHLLEYITSRQDPADPNGDAVFLTAAFPAMGINATFVGGDWSTGGANDGIAAIAGQFWVSRISQVRHPDDLMVFGSARVTGDKAQWVRPDLTLVEGWHVIRPPYLFEREWTSASYEPQCPPCEASDWGFVSLRHEHRSAVAGFMDLHADVLDEGQVGDMRHWADQADRPDWALEQP